MSHRRAKKVRQTLKTSVEPGYTTLGNGQIVSLKRMVYQRAKKAARQ